MIGRWNGGVNVFNTSTLVNTALKLCACLAFELLSEQMFCSARCFFFYLSMDIIVYWSEFYWGKMLEKRLCFFGISGLLMMVAGLFVLILKSQNSFHIWRFILVYHVAFYI
jgi:FHS family L-fucose permease-like MFS transporter